MCTKFKFHIQKLHPDPWHESLVNTSTSNSYISCKKLDVMVNLINAWICTYIYLTVLTRLYAPILIEFIFPPLSDHCSGFTLVEYIDCADVALRVWLEINFHPLVSLLIGVLDLLSVIICCCLFWRINIFYCHNRLKEPRNLYFPYVSVFFGKCCTEISGGILSLL